MTVEQRRLVAKWVLAFIFALIVLWVVFLTAGCSATVILPPVQSRTIAYDGEEQNAGVLKVWAGKGALLTDHKKAEYDALVSVYGRGVEGHAILPPVGPGDGLAQLKGKDQGFPLHEVVWFIDAQHLTYFILFKEWQRQGRK